MDVGLPCLGLYSEDLRVVKPVHRHMELEQVSQCKLRTQL
ncbi:Protein CBG27136 [Caenorhabditis briggsae]|uniref:Protein CBG27136 n=1 Tax=Caenorhabditis briggsae TaxID=6238 RepID=B6IL46_CAEBR|nr:Protein CBG27136 [Caenorhabditis briggsae]CAS00599.1 Protein CBG27136 [Caenorhabditis briggsae]